MFLILREQVKVFFSPDIRFCLNSNWKFELNSLRSEIQPVAVETSVFPHGVCLFTFFGGRFFSFLFPPEWPECEEVGVGGPAGRSGVPLSLPGLGFVSSWII